jgi:general secretion pathway protein A
MTPDYLAYMHLERAPFEMTGDPQFFFEGEVHSEALARLTYLVNDKTMGMAALTGEIGSGKSMLLSVLESRIRMDYYLVARIHTSALPFEALLEEITEKVRGQAGPDFGGDKYRLLKEFVRVLQERVVAVGKHLVIILDEAQFLPDETLDEIKCLTNYNQQYPALSIILSGQPELKERLRKLPQIYQRFGMFYHLGNLGLEDIYGYIEHRLKMAGSDRVDAFEPACIVPIYNYTRGCPRQINRICKLAIDRACSLEIERIDSRMIEMIIADIEKHFG